MGSPRRARWLERALLFTIAAHLLAMATMALLLLPGVPGGTPATALERASYVASHAWRWRLGWFPWQVTALSDLLLAWALVRTAWIPKGPAVAGLLMTVLAVCVEQPNELRWITTGVELAREAVRIGNVGAFLAFEERTFRMTSLWAATFYTIAAIFWSWALAAAGAWSRLLTVLSIVTWSLLLYICVAPLLPGDLTPGAKAIAAGNAAAFILMMLWFVLVTKKVRDRGAAND
jgi:hypothetical protein